MDNIKLLKQISKIQKSLLKDGIVVDKLTKELKTLRELFIEEKMPRIVKIIRLTYEHIEQYKTFGILIPEEEDVEMEELNEDDAKIESLSYLLSLLQKPTQKHNADDLNYYMQSFTEYSNAN